MKVVIVGGVAGGASAAARLRRLDEKADIVIIERTGYISYANCGLPYYVGGVITDKEDLTVQTPEGFRSRFNVDVRVRQEVVSADTDAKKVRVVRLEDGSEYDEPYDRLILSPGAKAIRPDLSGVDSHRIFTVRTVEDVLAIGNAIHDLSPKTAVVAGGGFIGLETAENLVERGIKVTIVQRPDQILATLDRDMACTLHSLFRKKGVTLELKASVTGFTTDSNIKTHLKDGRTLESDMVILAIGITPDTGFLKGSGIELGMKDSIVVNSHMETSVPGVYAVGDAVTVRNYVTGEDALIALAGPANKQGRIAADNICGIKSASKGSQGTSVIKLFDMTAASTGINERSAQRLGIPYGKVYTYSASHATYYPGSRNMSVKVLYDPETGRILGAQIVGREGVDKRIDVIATAIHAEMTASDLSELDLTYAPPYSSAKDPVNMAGYVIENVRSGLLEQYYWNDVDSLPRDGSVTLIDVRDPDEYAEGHICGFVNIPLDDIRGRLSEIPADRPAFLCCHSGLRSYIACRILMQNGIKCKNLAGGYRFYRTVVDDAPDDQSCLPCGKKK